MSPAEQHARELWLAEFAGAVQARPHRPVPVVALNGMSIESTRVSRVLPQRQDDMFACVIRVALACMAVARCWMSFVVNP